MDRQHKPLGTVILEALTACEMWEIVLVNFERPTLDSLALLRYKNSPSKSGVIMLSAEAVRLHYENHFRIGCDRPSVITVDELEHQFNHRISLLGDSDDEDDDGWGEEYLEIGEDITNHRYKDPTQEEVDDWKLQILELMQRRFEMLQEEIAKN